MAELLGNPMPVKGWTNDIDADTEGPGIVYCGENSKNIPESYCVLMTLGYYQRAQIAVATQTNFTYRRTNKGEWTKL